jgi:hypothetical protein
MPHGVFPLIEVLKRTADQVVSKGDWLPGVVAEYTGLGREGDSIRVIPVQGLEPVFEQGPPPYYVISVEEVYVYGSSEPLEEAASIAHFLDGDKPYWAIRHENGDVLFRSSHIVTVEV